MKVFVILWADGIVGGVYKDYRHAERLLFDEYIDLLKDRSSDYSGSEVAYDLRKFFEDGEIPGVGTIYEMEVKS